MSERAARRAAFPGTFSCAAVPRVPFRTARSAGLPPVERPAASTPRSAPGVKSRRVSGGDQPTSGYSLPPAQTRPVGRHWRLLFCRAAGRLLGPLPAVTCRELSAGPSPSAREPSPAIASYPAKCSRDGFPVSRSTSRLPRKASPEPLASVPLLPSSSREVSRRDPPARNLLGGLSTLGTARRHLPGGRSAGDDIAKPPGRFGAGTPRVAKPPGRFGAGTPRVAKPPGRFGAGTPRVAKPPGRFGAGKGRVAKSPGRFGAGTPRVAKPPGRFGAGKGRVAVPPGRC
jgi:hypothetical protein